MGFLDYNGLKIVYSKILTRFNNVTSAIDNIVNGTTTVLKASYATNANKANQATYAGTATNANNASLLDGNEPSYFATAEALGNCVQSGSTATLSGLLVKAQGGGEGGEITLEKAPLSDLSGGVNIDINVNSIRFFESGGNARGATLDLTECSALATSKILHTGNSNAIVFTEDDTTAPDANALWAHL